MKSLIFSVLSFLFVCQLAIAQNETDKKLKYFVQFSSARSTFHHTYTGHEVGNYPALELRLGGGMIKPIARWLELRASILIGVKFPVEAFYQGDIMNSNPQNDPVYDMDYAVDTENYVVDIPVVLQFNLSRKLALRGGLNARVWGDFLFTLLETNLTEAGVISGLAYKLTKKVSISADYYISLNKSLCGGEEYYNEQGEYVYYPSYEVNNQYAQFSIEYNF